MGEWNSLISNPMAASMIATCPTRLSVSPPSISPEMCFGKRANLTLTSREAVLTIPAQIHDIDGDGRLEVLCVRGSKFWILEGETGMGKATFALPHPDAHDCIVVCDLSGAGHPKDVILKDRYKRMWVKDCYWNDLWQYQENPGHYPWPHDFNGDGRDEVMAGYELLNHDGEKLWSCQPLDDHADCMIVGKIRPDVPHDRIVIGGSVTVLYDSEGTELWRYAGSKESRHVAVGKYSDSASKVQIARLDRIKRGHDGMFLLTSAGEEIWKEDRKVRG
jgi:hypothetical protein